MREITFRAWDGDITYGYKQHGYQMRQVKWHPNSNKRGYVMEHRLIMEKQIGKFLPKHAIIHHKNNVRDDNRIENLEYMEEQERHAKHHDTGKRNPNGQFVAQSDDFLKKKFRLLNKNTGLLQILTLQKLIATTFRKSQFEYRGEFTGLKDKNGKEIYEGDILEVDQDKDNLIGFVQYNLTYFNIIVNFEDPNLIYESGEFYNCVSFQSVKDRPHEFEVIGNIHENEDLLNN